MGFRRGVTRTATAVGAAAVVLFGGSVFAPGLSAQECAGTISTTVATSGLPGGQWSVTDGCLKADAFYEYSDGPIQAKAAVSTVTYDDGHSGRVAAGTLTLGNDFGLTIVGVEDSATGLVKWSAALGDYSDTGDTVTVSGDGVSLFPTAGATVSVSISGTGTDVTALANPQGATTTTVASEAPPSIPGPPTGEEPLPAPGAESTTTTTAAPEASPGDPGSAGPDNSGPETTVPPGAVGGSDG